TLAYRLSRPDGPVTVVSILDELPAELGGDLAIDAVSVSGAEICELSRPVLPTSRGIRDHGPAHILWRSRLALFRFRTTAAEGGQIAIVPPASIPQRRAALTHRSLLGELGIRPRSARGEGAEFESLREYVVGDDPRHIDWRATARRAR